MESDRIKEIKQKLAERDAEYAEAHYPRRFDSGTTDYKLPLKAGVDLYCSYSDNELLDILRARGELTGGLLRDYQVLDIYAEYIKYRFLTWGSALIAAGFDIKQDAAHREIDIAQNIDPASQLAKWLYIMYIPMVMAHPELRANADKTARMIKGKYRFDTSQSYFIIKTIETDRNNRKWFRPETLPACEKEAEAARSFAAELGRTPIITELPEEIAVPLWCATGYWLQMLNISNLPRLSPIEEFKAKMVYGVAHCGIECLPGVKREKLHMREEALLSGLCSIARKLGRTPEESEVPEETRALLVKLFGKLSTGLIQLGLYIKTKKIAESEDNSPEETQ